MAELTFNTEKAQTFSPENIGDLALYSECNKVFQIYIIYLCMKINMLPTGDWSRFEDELG